MVVFGVAQIQLEEYLINSFIVILSILSPFRRIWHKKKFAAICRANGLKLDAAINVGSLLTLEEVFVLRTYSDYFPFYKKVVIIDIGAHKGYFTLFAHKNVLQGSTIIAVEPSVENTAMLNKNLRDNEASDVNVVEGAVHTADEIIKLYTGKSANHTIVASLPIENGNEYTHVQGIRLSTLWDKFQLEKIDFLKMDCEGAEYDILFQLPKTIFDKIEVISMEFHDLKKPGYSALDLAGHLIQMGYEILKMEHLATNQNLNYGRLIARRIQVL